MNHHQNARLTDHNGELLVRRIVERGLRAEEAAQAMGVSAHCPHATPTACREAVIERRKGRQTCRPISQALSVRDVFPTLEKTFSD